MGLHGKIWSMIIGGLIGAVIGVYQGFIGAGVGGAIVGFIIGGILGILIANFFVFIILPLLGLALLIWLFSLLWGFGKP